MIQKNPLRGKTTHILKRYFGIKKHFSWANSGYIDASILQIFDVSVTNVQLFGKKASLLIEKLVPSILVPLIAPTALPYP